MKGAVMEKPRVQARIHRMKSRGMLSIIRIGALLERQSELGLSDDQLKQLLSIRTDMIKTKAKLNGDIRVARLELIYSAAMNIGNINPDQLRSSIKNIYALKLERKAATIDAFKKAADVLSSDQKEKLKEIIVDNLADYEADMEDITSENED